MPINKVGATCRPTPLPLRRLQYLKVHDSCISNNSLQHISVLNRLERLCISHCEGVSEDGVAHLTALTQLKMLSLQQCTNVRDGALQYIPPLTSLTHLDIEGCWKIGDSGVAYLVGARDLRHINLGWTFVTEVGIRALLLPPQQQDSLIQCRQLLTLVDWLFRREPFLVVAAQAGNAAVVQLLLDAGADASDGFALRRAAEGGHCDVIRRLADYGADVYGADALGFAAVHHACRNGHVGAVALLAALGTDVRRTTKVGWSPAFIAACHGHSVIERVLARHGADTTISIWCVRLLRRILPRNSFWVMFVCFLIGCLGFTTVGGAIFIALCVLVLRP